MKPSPSTLCLIAIVATSAGAAPLDDLADLPFRFEANVGQAPASADYVARAAHHTLLLDGGGFSIDLGPSGRMLRVDLVDTGGAIMHRAERSLPGVTSYFRGNDPERWIRAVPGSARVRYSGVYPNVDVVYYGRHGLLEYDFEVRPGSDPGRIRFRVSGADETYLDVDGHLVLRVDDAELTLRRPVAHQEIAGERVDVPVVYTSVAPGTYAFDVGPHDGRHALTIDPVIEYATFFGGNGEDHGWDVAVDDDGNAYVTGNTTSTNIHTSTGAFDEVGHVGGFFDPNDVFIGKIDASGSALVYGTYLSGRFADVAYSIAVDDSGCAYVMGTTDSDDDPTTGGVDEGFPLRNPIQPTYGGNTDLFVAKLNADGTDLVYSTYVGGNDLDRGDSEQDKPGIAVDAQGAAYVAGGTQSTNFPTTPGAFSTSGPGPFALKIDPSGGAFDYATFLGGDTFVFVWDCVVDEAGQLLLCGFTGNPNLPTTAGVIGEVKDVAEDGFIYKVNADGSDLVFCTYFGASSDDFLHAIDIDPSGNVYVAGFTTSADYPVTSGSVPGGGGAPISKLDADATAVQYSLFTGGSFAYAIGVDQLGRASVTGDAAATPPDRDVFFTHISAAGGIEFETFWGGFFRDIGWGLDVDGFGHAYVTGVTSSSSFPGDIVNNPTPLQGSISSVPDAFVVKLLRDDPVSVATQTPPPLVLTAVRPNPAAAGASIEWTQSEPSLVTVRVFDAAGRLVRMLVHEHRGVGDTDAWWDATDRRGRRVAPGTYYARIDAGGFSRSVPVVVVR